MLRKEKNIDGVGLHGQNGEHMRPPGKIRREQEILRLCL